MPVKSYKISGKGSTNKGYGKTGPKRFYRNNKEAILGITKPAIKRLARKGGVKRISVSVYGEVRNSLISFIEKVVKDSVVFTEHAKRKTVTLNDVIYSLKRHGKTIYGF